LADGRTEVRARPVWAVVGAKDWQDRLRSQSDEFARWMLRIATLRYSTYHTRNILLSMMSLKRLPEEWGPVKYSFALGSLVR
jgi:hypothetical protein